LFGEQQRSQKEAIDEIDLDFESHFKEKIGVLRGINIGSNDEEKNEDDCNPIHCEFD
jgi:hypothetical protein